MSGDAFFHVICIKTDSGLPLFVRSVGCDQQPPDTVISSLNGIYTFCSSYDVKLLKTTAGDTCISWKTFYGSLTLILVTNVSAEDWFHERIFNLIINSFVMFLGSEQLQQNANFDKLKKDLQICYCLVDNIIALDEPHLLPRIMTQTVDCLASPDQWDLQRQFEEYASNLKVTRACFFIRGLLSAATKKWMQLSAVELVLLQRFVASATATSSSNIIETVVYLSDVNPAEYLRLIALNLLRDGVICLLCDGRLQLSEIVLKTQTFWESRSERDGSINLSKGNLDFVQNLLRMTNRSLPHMADANKDIVSFLLINNSMHCSLTCTDLNKSERDSNLEQGEILRAFYQHVAHKFFDETSTIENVGQDISVPCRVERAHSALESYMCLETHKCYALQEEEREIYVVFSNDVPTCALRSASKEFLRKLIGSKWFHL